MPVVQRITQKRLARLAGVSHTTVSLALRGHPKISRGTSRRILELAAEHGYRPDPALSALNAYRVGKSRVHYQGTLAWLTNFRTPDSWRSGAQMEGYFLGAREQASQLGYSLEDFWMGDPSLSPVRISQILVSRGISGLLVAPQPSPHSKVEFDWSLFPAVTFGYSLAQPQLHMVMNHQFRNMQRVVRELRHRGYRRLGIAMPAVNDERVDHNYLSGFWIENHTTRLSLPIAPLLTNRFTFPVFSRWLRRYKPDAIITATNCAAQVEKWLTELGRDVPGDMGLAVPAVPFRETRFSGVDENVRLIGSIAVDSLVGMIHRNEKGAPQFPLRILVEGTWHEGNTLKKP